MNIIAFPRKPAKSALKLKILTQQEFEMLNNKDPEGVYDRDIRESLYWTLEKLEEHFRKCSKVEKALYKRFENAHFGIRIAKGAVCKGNIDHPGSIIIDGHFEGNIHSGKTITLMRTGSVVGEVFAQRILSQGKIKGDVKANNQVWLGPRSKVVGDIVTPSIIMNQGAHLEGQCVMIRVEKIALPMPVKMKRSRNAFLNTLRRWSLPRINTLRAKIFNIK
jgi:cytoskeletal protein CcmA (bactofilin family)